MSTTVPVDQSISEPAHVRLETSREYCRQLTRAAAKNFYYGLKLLPPQKRSAMFALYAYMRQIDDIADDNDGRSVEQRESDLEQWRILTHAAVRGELPAQANHDLWPAFSDVVQRHRIPATLFDDAIAGQRQDLRPVEPANFNELREYCYRVAGVVGVASIHIWGFSGGAETESLAVDRGIAFQLTNILRDVREDAALGRIYLPREDLAAAGLSDEDILRGRGSEKFGQMIRHQAARAESFFEISQPLEERIDRDSRPTPMAMTDIYRGILKKVAADPLRILQERVSLSVLSKLRIAWRATRSAQR